MDQGDIDLGRLVVVLDGNLLVPTPDPPSVPGACEVVEPEQLLVAMHEDDLGLAFPAFTSAESFLRWQPAGGLVAQRSGWAVAELTVVDQEGRLIIDAGSGEAMVVPAAGLRPLLEARSVGADPAAITGPQVLVAGSNEPLPTAVARAVGHVVGSAADVVAAHLVVIDDGSGAPGRCVALRLQPDADPAALVPALLDAIAALAPEAAGLTFTVVADDLAAAVASSGTDLLAR